MALAAALERVTGNTSLGCTRDGFRNTDPAYRGDSGSPVLTYSANRNTTLAPHRVSGMEAGTGRTIPHLFKFATLARVNSRFNDSLTRNKKRKALQRCRSIARTFMTGPLAYIGGKNRIAKQIIALFPAHQTFVEPFAGGAQVLFHKEPSPVEVLNDLDGEVVNFYRILQRHYEELLRYLRFILVGRKWFTLLEAENPQTLTDIQRAARFLYLQRCSFGGHVKRRRYSCAVVNRPNFNPARLPELFEKTYRRLQRVQIECLPYSEIIRRFDKPATLFYLDPPYWGRKFYNFNFSEEDFRSLADQLHTICGKFVLSVNDVPELRELFRDFKIREIAFHYTSQRKAGKRFRELIITNF